MALSLSGERSVTAATPTTPIRAFFAWIAKARVAHNRRRALRSLLALEAYRLHDLGISRADIIDAMKGRNGRTSGMILNSARARQSRA